MKVYRENTMRVKTKFPRERGHFLLVMRCYILFLGAATIAVAIVTGLRTVQGDITGALAYLTAMALFLTSVIISREFYHLIKRTRFTVYWMTLRANNVPMGGYASIYIIASVIFFTADLLRGSYFPLAVLLLLRGFFEYLLDRAKDDITIVSFLYYIIEQGDLETAEIKDPFR